MAGGAEQNWLDRKGSGTLLEQVSLE